MGLSRPPAAAFAASSSAPRHLVADISSHGLGHLAQAAAVLNEIDFSSSSSSSFSSSGEEVKLTVRSAAPARVLRERIRHRPFDVIPMNQDNGMIMRDALTVDAGKTMEWYRGFHSNYSERVSDAARQLDSLEPDLVFSDVPYLCLDAASLVGVPSVALCSLNWAGVFKSYCGRYDGAGDIYDEILEAYGKAELFLRPAPSMDMTGLNNVRDVSPVSFVGRSDRRDLLRKVAGGGDCDEDDIKYVLVGVGGYGIDGFPLDSWPRARNDVRWIFPDGVLSQRPGILGAREDFCPQSRLDAVMPYIDLLASSDLVLTKTGYGTQVEAAVNRVPAICVCRHDWPEHGNLAEWHDEFGVVEFVEWEEVGGERFASLVEGMLGMNGGGGGDGSAWTRKEPVVPTGAQEAAEILQERLFR